MGRLSFCSGTTHTVGWRRRRTSCDSTELRDRATRAPPRFSWQVEEIPTRSSSMSSLSLSTSLSGLHHRRRIGRRPVPPLQRERLSRTLQRASRMRLVRRRRRRAVTHNLLPKGVPFSKISHHRLNLTIDSKCIEFTCIVNKTPQVTKK